MNEELYQTLKQIHDLLSDGRIFMAREQLETLLGLDSKEAA
jgi:hypothetical protein